MHSLPLYGPSQLCRYDTVLCTLVLECAKIGFTVRKIEYDRDSPKDGRLACGDIPVDHSFLEDAIIKIIKSKVVTGNDSRSASDELLKLLSHRKCSGLLKYIEKVPNSTMHTPYEGVGSYIERSEFMKLATAYFNIYGPHSEIEVGQSPKYNTPNDGCIITTSRIEKGHFIKGLEGILVKLSKDDSTNLDGRDLSIIFMTQKKLTCILLGPARFVNHDCTPNCAFVTPCSKSKKIFLKALKQIDPGTELTVYYGKHYFSQENGDCMCSTCESLKKIDRGASMPPHESPPADVLECGPVRRTRFVKTSQAQNSSTLGGVSRCTLCRTPKATLHETSMKSPPLHSNTSKQSLSTLKRLALNCRRCSRHFLIYGLPWPIKKVPQKRRGFTRKCTKLTINNKDPDGPKPYSSAALKLRATSTKVLIVFVRPNDPRKPYWSPALLVPPKRLEGYMPKVSPKSGDLIVAHIDNSKSFSIVTISDIYPFSPFEEPFKTYARNFAQFKQDIAVVRGIQFFFTPDFPLEWIWANWFGDKTNSTSNIYRRHT